MAKVNIKQLAIEHVEKGVFGLFVLIALFAILGTNWTPYQGTPSEITQRIDSGRKTLKANKWPEEEKVKYIIAEEDAPANIVNERLRKEYSPAQVEMSGKMVVDLFGNSEPVREPVLYAPQDPIVSSARVFLQLFDDTMLDSATPEDALAMNKPKEEEDPSILDEFRKKDNVAGMGLGGEGMELQSYEAAIQPEEMMLMEGEMTGEEGELGPTMADLKGEGRHFVSVRAVFPLRDQITAYAEAIHRSFHTAALTFDIRNFELERQVAQPGDNPWSGPWEKVDLQVARDVLDKAAGFEAEIVNSMITNSVITMPLPMRISGKWVTQATHPRIEKFQLSPSEIETEVEMQRKLLQEAVKQHKQMDAATIKRGGFTNFVIDSRQLNSDVMGGGMFQGGMGMGMGMGGMGMGADMGMGMGGGAQRPRGAGSQVDPMQKLIEDMAKGSANRKEEEKRIREWIQSRVSAEGELLLFRYFDFGVEPGKTYRYRVRFILANPNFGKRIADAGGLNHVVEGETRETPWSEITKPVTVDKDVRYFLTGFREQFGRVLPSVNFDVFEWAQEHGTFVNSTLEIRYGQMISQKKKTTVIDPAKHFNEEQDFVFKSTDFPVDSLKEIEFDESFHEKADDNMNVKLPPGIRGKIQVSPKVLVGSIDQDLNFRSPVYSAAEHKTQKIYMEKQAEQFEYLKEKEEEEGADLLAEFGIMEGSVEGETGRSGRGPKNSLRKNRRGKRK